MSRPDLDACRSLWGVLVDDQFRGPNSAQRRSLPPSELEAAPQSSWRCDTPCRRRISAETATKAKPERKFVRRSGIPIAPATALERSRGDPGKKGQTQWS